MDQHYQEFIFHRGLIPLPNGEYAEIDELNRRDLARGVLVEPSAKGPVVAIPSSTSEKHNIGLPGSEENEEAIKWFLRKAFKR